MSESRFSCPHCQTHLRIRDRKFLGKQIHCPDCAGPILIELNDSREFVGVKASASALVSSSPILQQTPSSPEVRTASAGESSTSGIPLPKTTTRLGTGLTNFFMNPMVFAWVVAGVVTTALIVVIWPDSQPPQSLEIPETAIPQTRNSPAPDKAPLVPEIDLLEARYLLLGKHLLAYHDAEQKFPSGAFYEDGLPLQDRFSWIAEVVHRNHPDGPDFHPQLAWTDPQNEQFVRRSQPDFLNPHLPVKAGTWGYPATHFVGVAGVGEDGPLLAVDHPRAGIFALNRTTRLEDIQDGTTQTMMIAGVQEKLGSWAGAGSGTIRSFTQEPYINGPDGFGTGSPKSMIVLMADGSVRTITQETAPTIVRRMAAMNDGLPLDPEVPGEPGDPISPPDTPEEPPVVAERPPTPELEPEEEIRIPEDPPLPQIDVDRAFGQKIVRYELAEARSVRELLQQVEEMAGIPISLEGLSPESLDRKISLTVENTTVGGLFRELLNKAELTYEILNGVIEVRPMDNLPARVAPENQEPPS